MHHTGVGIQSFYLLVTSSFADLFFFCFSDYTLDVLARFARTRVFLHSLSTTYPFTLLACF